MPPIEHDVAERIVRLETKLDFLIGQMDRLPPSPTCLTKHIEFDSRLESIEAWRNRAIGVVLVFNIVIVLFMDKIRSFFTGQ
jgi:hypothetical protein